MPDAALKTPMNHIHPTAIVAPEATLGEGVRVGPYCIVGPKVVLEKDVVLHSHVVIEGDTLIGEGTEIFPFASIGTAPQDLKFHGEPSKLVIGKRNKIREHVTMNPGTEGGGMLTQVGDDCLFMMGSHVAHDCKVGNRVILANNATLAGHVEVGDFAVIGGLSAVHQFVRIGHHAMIGGMSGIENDVIPYGQASGKRANLVGLNLIGLKRRGFEKDAINQLRRAFEALFGKDGTLDERLATVETEFKDLSPVKDIAAFLKAEGSRAVCLPEKSRK